MMSFKKPVLVVVVGMRKGRPTYGHQLFIPTGFAHRLVTLKPDCEVIYKCSDTDAPERDGGIRWHDPMIGIDWPISASIMPELSAKDVIQPLIADFNNPFLHNGRPLDPLA